MAVAPGVLWLTVIGWGLPFNSLPEGLGPALGFAAMSKKMNTAFILLNMIVRI